MQKTIQYAAVLVLSFFIFSFQNGTQQSAIPKVGTLTIKAKSEISFWKGVAHSSFRIHLSNPSKINSCEAYIVKNGQEKWISPSLLAQGELDFNVPKNAYIFFKNFSNEDLIITYSID